MSAPPPEPPAVESAAPASPAAPVDNSPIARAANALVLWFARHWLALFNTAWALYVGLPFVAAIFMQMGLVGPARILYTLYSFTCHQLPDHSYFLFGPTLSPSEAQLVAAGMPAAPDLFVQRAFVGNEAIGFKVALCQRDVAIYAAVLGAGLLFALLRPRLRPLSMRWFVLLALPMAIDGGTQLFGWRESTWLLRSLTGGLFGAAAVWWAYPYIDEAMRDVIETERRRAAAIDYRVSSIE